MLAGAVQVSPSPQNGGGKGRMLRLVTSPRCALPYGLRPPLSGGGSSPPARPAEAQACLPYRPAPYLVVSLEAPGRALVLLRVRGSSGRGFAAVGSRVPGADALRPARGLPPRRRAPEPPAAAVETVASGRVAAAVRPGPVAVGRRVVGAPVGPRGGGHRASSAGERAPEPAARVRRRRGAEGLPVHDRGPARRWRRGIKSAQRRPPTGASAGRRRVPGWVFFFSPPLPPFPRRAPGRFRAQNVPGRGRRRGYTHPSVPLWKREGGKAAPQPSAAVCRARPEEFCAFSSRRGIIGSKRGSEGAPQLRRLTPVKGIAVKSR